MHGAMEIFWSSITTSKALASTTDSDIEKASEAAVLESASRYGIADKFGAVMASLECKQTTAIVFDYIMQVKKSGLEFEVLENEYKSTVDISGLSFNLRLDQVLSTDGSPWVLDFKRSKSHKTQWMKNHTAPASLQLPIYSALCSHNGVPFKGIAIAKVHQEEVSLMSVGAQGIHKSSCTEDDWDTLNKAWGTEVNDLVSRFISADVHMGGTFYPDMFEKRIALLA